MKEISVIGSCVCRDLFEKDTENFSFHTDIRFSSPISMLSAPVESVHADFDSFIKDVPVVNGKWYRKNLINDINKTAFKALEERHGEYLVLDFAESRISLGKIRWKDSEKTLLVTNSSSFRAHYAASFCHNILKDTTVEDINPLDYDDDFWKKTIKDYYEKITKLFDEEKIILIKNMPARHFVDAAGYLHPYFTNFHFDSIMLCDLLLEKLNGYFLECCPKCKVIEIPPFAIGSQLHKWGNHPFHFTEIYYEYLLGCVKALTLDGDESKICDLYSKYAVLFKEEYEAAKRRSATRESGKNSPYSIVELLRRYEEFDSLGKKQKAMILFALDKKNFVKNFKEATKKSDN